MTQQTRLATFDIRDGKPVSFFGPVRKSPLTADDAQAIRRTIASVNEHNAADCVNLFPWRIADQLREAIRKSGLTEKRLAKLAGVPVASLRSFLDGRDIALSRASQLARAIGLTLTKDLNPRPPAA